MSVLTELALRLGAAGAEDIAGDLADSLLQRVEATGERWIWSEVQRVRGEHNEAVTFYSQALPIYTVIGNRQGRAKALSGLANVHRAREEYSQAVILFYEALQIHTNIGDGPASGRVRGVGRGG